jgi:putative Mg2+ transporter-C (MgtC) family protein
MFLQETLRILVAAALGGLIGSERERLDRAAGLRTHALVATASALIMIVSSYGFSTVVTANHTVVLDPSRIAAQVVSGIGFLGAGLIILRKNTVYGLTTAASIWAVAAIGLAAGAGLLAIAVVTTMVILLILVVLKWAEQRFFGHKRLIPFTLTLAKRPGQLAAIEAMVTQAGLELWQWQLKPGKRMDEQVMSVELRGGTTMNVLAIAEQLQQVPGMKRLSYQGGQVAGETSEQEDADQEAEE